jgi:hypothetical protein
MWFCRQRKDTIFRDSHQNDESAAREAEERRSKEGEGTESTLLPVCQRKTVGALLKTP